MAKESMKAREVKRAKLVAKYAAKRAELKAAGDYEDLQAYLKMLLLYVCTIVVKLQVVRKAMYASSVFLVFNCVKWHLMV